MDSTSTLASHQTVLALTSANASIASLVDTDNSPLAEEIKGRVEYLLWVIEQSDSALVSRTELNALLPHSQNLTTHLTASPINLKSANAELDQYYLRLPYPRFKKIPRSESQRIIEQVQLQAEQSASQTREAIENLQQDFTGLRTALVDIAGKSSEISSRISRDEEIQKAL